MRTHEKPYPLMTLNYEKDKINLSDDRFQRGPVWNKKQEPLDFPKRERKLLADHRVIMADVLEGELIETLAEYKLTMADWDAELTQSYQDAFRKLRTHIKWFHISDLRSQI